MKFALLALLIIFPTVYAASTKIHPRQITADEQASGSKSDIELTRRLRERLMKDDSLSVYAKNITIVTLGKKMTLKGEVASKAEGERIATIARTLAKVTNELVYTK